MKLRGRRKGPRSACVRSVMRLRVHEPHLDPLPLNTRSQECLCLPCTASDVVRSLIDVAACRRVWAAPWRQRAFTATGHGCEVSDRMIAVDPPTRRQRLPLPEQM
jgi:hypothetical protein